MYICLRLGIGLGGSQERFGPRLQDCAAAALDLVFPACQPSQELPTFSCTAALLPKHRFPVASSRAHPQMASSALKSGL